MKLVDYINKLEHALKVLKELPADCDIVDNNVHQVFILMNKKMVGNFSIWEGRVSYLGSIRK